METERLETPTFHFVAASKLPRAGCSVVLYAEEIVAPTRDYEHFVFLASVDDDAKRVLDRVSLNDLLPLHMDFPGEFYELDGAITPLVISEGTMIDLTTRTLLTGSGGITAISDFFFRVGSRGKLNLVLQLPDAGGHGRGGWSWERSTSSEVFIAPSGEEIAVHTWTITRTYAKFDGPPKDERDDKGYTLYRLEGDRFVARGTVMSYTGTMKPIPRPFG